jgi:hypothetical protein
VIDEPEATPPLLESKIPKGNRPAVHTFKENSKGVAIPGKAEAKANAIAVRKASRQPDYQPTEEDAFNIAADAFNRGKLENSHVISAEYNPKTGKWTIGESGKVPENMSPQLGGWANKTQRKVDSGKIKPHEWLPGNCSEPNALHNSTQGKSQALEGRIVYTFERNNALLYREMSEGVDGTRSDVTC